MAVPHRPVLTPATIDHVRRIVAGVMDIDVAEVSLLTDAHELPNWDSMGTIHLALALEGDFGVVLTTDEIADLQSVRAVAELLHAKGIV
jgi:acyl carrier protein